jgi:hypothetical protein
MKNPFHHFGCTGGMAAKTDTQLFTEVFWEENKNRKVKMQQRAPQ